MFHIPIDEITMQDIEQFLQSGVREGVLLDFKVDFPKKLDKTMSSMANTYGGMVLIGVDETATGGGVVPVKGVPLVPGLREKVIQIGIDSIYPPLIPEVKVVEFRSDPALADPDRAVVVIRVHEAEEGHAVEGRTTIYLRTDNISDPFTKATIEELEWFLNKRQKSLAEKDRIIRQAQKHAQSFLGMLRYRYQRSTAEPLGRFAIWSTPTFPRFPIATPRQLKEVSIKRMRPTPGIAHNSFPTGQPRAVLEGVSWAYDELSDYYYTELQQQGLIYTEVEFWWDREVQERTFYPNVAAKLLWAAAAFARDVYRDCGYFGRFDLVMRVAGVADRAIDAVPRNPPRVIDNIVEAKSTLKAASSEKDMMPQCKEMIREFYWAFGREASERQLDADFN